MNTIELKFIEDYVKKLIHPKWLKVVNQLCSIEDLINEATLAVVRFKQKNAWPRYGNSTIRFICRNRIVHYLNRDLRWFTKTGKRTNPKYYETIIPFKIGHLNTLQLGREWKYDWTKRMKEADLESEQKRFISGISKNELKKHKKRFRHDFWEKIA